jgi:ribosomal protein L17
MDQERFKVKKTEIMEFKKLLKEEIRSEMKSTTGNRSQNSHSSYSKLVPASKDHDLATSRSQRIHRQLHDQTLGDDLDYTLKVRDSCSFGVNSHQAS